MSKEKMAISLDNFEMIAKAYRPLLLKQTAAVFQKNHQDARLEFEDLMQEALMGVYKAIEKFDPTRGVYFGVYLAATVQNNLSYYARNTLPHRYEQTTEKYASGLPKFACVKVQVGSLDEMMSR